IQPPKAPAPTTATCGMDFTWECLRITRTSGYAEAAWRGKMRDEIPVSYTPSAMHPRTNPRSRCLLLFGVVSLLISALLFAQDSAPSRAAAIVDSMPHAKKISEAAFSPDGMQVAYIVDDKLTVASVSGGSPHTIAVEGNPLGEVVWSADSKRI